MKKQIRRGELQRIMLDALTHDQRVSIRDFPESMTFVLEPFFGDKKVETRNYIKRTLKNLLKTEKIIVKVDDIPHYTLTAKGFDQLRKQELFSTKQITQNHKDGTWRVLSFDILEKERWKREVVRRQLKRLGFVMLHKSVWASPYECRKQVSVINNFLGLDNNIIYFESDKIFRYVDLLK